MVCTTPIMSIAPGVWPGTVSLPWGINSHIIKGVVVSTVNTR